MLKWLVIIGLNINYRGAWKGDYKKMGRGGITKFHVYIIRGLQYSIPLGDHKIL